MILLYIPYNLRKETIILESYVERWKREQAEEAKKQKRQKTRRIRKEAQKDGRTEAQGQTEGQKGL